MLSFCLRVLNMSHDFIINYSIFGKIYVMIPSMIDVAENLVVNYIVRGRKAGKYVTPAKETT